MVYSSELDLRRDRTGGRRLLSTTARESGCFGALELHLVDHLRLDGFGLSFLFEDLLELSFVLDDISGRRELAFIGKEVWQGVDATGVLTATHAPEGGVVEADFVEANIDRHGVVSLFLE
jgi:hypothetical protein